MPIYNYEDCHAHGGLDYIERNVAVDDRDKQTCRTCGCRLKRKITFTGLTWAPTAGGMR